MTSPEILAGDFLKSLLQNFPGEDNSIPEKSDHPQKESKNQKNYDIQWENAVKFYYGKEDISFL